MAPTGASTAPVTEQKRSSAGWFRARDRAAGHDQRQHGQHGHPTDPDPAGADPVPGVDRGWRRGRPGPARRRASGGGVGLAHPRDGDPAGVEQAVGDPAQQGRLQVAQGGGDGQAGQQGGRSDDAQPAHRGPQAGLVGRRRGCGPGRRRPRWRSARIEVGIHDRATTPSAARSASAGRLSAASGRVAGRGARRTRRSGTLLGRRQLVHRGQGLGGGVRVDRRAPGQEAAAGQGAPGSRTGRSDGGAVGRPGQDGAIGADRSRGRCPCPGMRGGGGGAPLSCRHALRGPDPRLRRPLRPAAAPDPARAGRSLRGLADAPSSTPSWPRWPPSRSTSTSRWPPSSCSSPPPWSSSRPAGCCPTTTDLDLDDELALWEERDLLHRPPARVQDLQGRGRRPGRPVARGGPLVPPHRRARGSLPRPDPRPARGRHARRPGRGHGPGADPRPVPMVEIAHIHAVRVSVVEAVEELVDELPRVGPHHLPGPDRAAGRAPRGGGALPGRARAVQAGPDRPRPGRQLRRHRDPLAGSGRGVGDRRRSAPTWPPSTPTRADDRTRPAGRSRPS